MSFSELAAAADPAVVQVRIQQEKPSRSGRRRLTREGLGSAFVYDSNGLLLTNQHVVGGASEIRVVFKDGRDLLAEIVGADPPTDIAVLRVGEHELPALPLGNSDELRVGDWVLAIGNPFGLSHTVSAGIVSGRGRTIRDLDGLGDGTGYFDFLQTDASINPGNSGGPLIDVGGRVIGISTAIRAHSNKIGFAIPINMVRELLPALVSSGRVQRSALGVRVDTILADDVRRLRPGIVAGAIVRAVQPHSGAEKAGFHVDDIIVEFQGQPILGPERLRWLASMAGVDRQVTVKIQRLGQFIDLAASLGELPATSSPVLDESDEDEE
jgi:serine protease Do